jgi:Leucine-rich repeat (LRR) protein
MKTTLLFVSVFLTVSLFGQNVYIPDANFKAYLVGNSQINTNSDTEIQLSEASSYDGSVICGGLNISDLTGLEAFTAIIQLGCYVNQLTSLDVSQNTALTELYCYDNQLTSLDVTQNTALGTLSCGVNQLTSLDLSQNTALAELSCYSNQLTSLDVSQNTALTELFCYLNQLTSLDVSQNTALTVLWCLYNQLTSLDVSQNTALTELSCYENLLMCLNISNGNNYNFAVMHAYDNPSLTCIEVDDASWSTANWSNFVDFLASFSENCNYPSGCFSASLNELTTSKNLIQILDLMGRETTFKPNTPLIYVYDDGTIEKVFSVEY